MVETGVWFLLELMVKVFEEPVFFLAFFPFRLFA